MTAARVLVVEDDPTTADLVALYLRHAGHAVDVERRGDAARARLRQERYDLVVLDVMLPGVDGLTLCREARGRDMAVILLTARTREDERVAGLELGADDYVTKPFSPRELTARVAAVLRRAPPAERAFTRGPLEFWPSRHAVVVGGTEVAFTASEFALLLALARRPRAVLSRAQLLDALPGDGGESLDRTIDVHVSAIRRKLRAVGVQGIETVVGAGYRLAAAEAAR